MADDLTLNRQQQFITRCNQLIDGIPAQVAQLAASLSDTNANWAGYAAIQDDTEKLTAAGAAFAARVATAWENPNLPQGQLTSKQNLETALDILAGGMGTTRNALLASMQTE